MIRTYKHPFELTPSKTLFLETGGTLQQYIDACGVEPDAHLVILNGGIVPKNEWLTRILAEGDDLIIKPLVMGEGGGKTALRLLVMVAVVVASVYLGPMVTVAYGHLAGALVVGAIAAAGAAISVYALGPPKPQVQTQTSTYSWSGPQTTAQQGSVVPKPYGTYPQSGNVISSFVESYATTQYMNILLSLGWGPARNVSEIKLNGTPFSEYPGSSYEVRLGHRRQSTCSGFNRIVSTVPVGAKIVIGGTAVTVMGTRTDTNRIEAEISFPRGIWKGPSKEGKYLPWGVCGTLEYRKVGASEWISHLVPRNPVDVGPTPYWLAIVGRSYTAGDNHTYVAKTSNKAQDHYLGEPFTDTSSLDIFDDSGTPAGSQTTTVSGTWQLNPNNPATGATPSGSSYVYATAWSKQSWSYVSSLGATPTRYIVNVELPERGRYEYRFRKTGDGGETGIWNGTTAYQDSTDRGEETWVSDIREISAQELTYPHQILLAMRIKATDRISGSAVTVSALVTSGAGETQGYVHSVLADKPKYYYRLGETSGTVAADLTGRRDGTYGTTAALGHAPLVHNSIGHSILVSSGNAAVSFPVGTPFTAVELLYCPTVGEGFLMFRENTGPGVQLHPDGRLTLEHWTGTAWAVIGWSTEKLSIGLINHVVVLMRNNSCRFIVNGVMDAGVFDITGEQTDFTHFFEGCTGYASELAFYDEVVPASRFKQHSQMYTQDCNLFEAYPPYLQSMVVWDMFTNPLYGGGISLGQMDVDFFERWSKRCLEPMSDGLGHVINRYEYNAVADTTSTLWDAAAEVAHTAGATLVRNGVFYTGIMDAPSIPKQLFNVANVIKGTFEESWSNPDQRANSIDIIFYDETNNYEKTTLTVQLDSELNNGKPLKAAAQVDLRGCTNISRAWRHGRFILRSGQLLTRSAKFDTPVDSIACLLGDTVLIQHDLPRWGEGGKVASGSTASVIQLDKDVEFDAEKQYQLVVILKSVTIATVTVTGVGDNTIYFTSALEDTSHASRLLVNGIDRPILRCGTYWVQVDNSEGIYTGDVCRIVAQDYLCTRNVVSVKDGRVVTVDVALPGVPELYDSYTYGVVAASVQAFHLTGIQRRKDLTATMTFLEYSDAVYEDEEPPAFDGTIVSDAGAAVESLVGVEEYSPDGLSSYYIVSWTKGANTAGTRVFKGVNGQALTLLEDAYTTENSVRFPVNEGDVVEVKVVGFDNNGISAPYSTAPSVSDTIQGSSQNPLNVQNFSIGSWDEAAQSLTLNWTANTDFGLAGYRLYFHNSLETSPTAAQLYTEFIRDVAFPSVSVVLTVGSHYYGRGTYLIRAFNNTGHLSVAAAAVRVGPVQAGLNADGTIRQNLPGTISVTGTGRKMNDLVSLAKGSVGSNVLINPSFEDVAATGSNYPLAVGWLPEESDAYGSFAAPYLSSTYAVSGSRSFAVGIGHDIPGYITLTPAGHYSAYFNDTKIPCREGQPWKVSAHVRTTSLGTDTSRYTVKIFACARVFYTDNSFLDFPTNSEIRHTSGGFTELMSVFTVPAGSSPVKEMRFYIIVQSSSVTTNYTAPLYSNPLDVYFDNVSLFLLANTDTEVQEGRRYRFRKGSHTITQTIPAQPWTASVSALEGFITIRPFVMQCGDLNASILSADFVIHGLVGGQAYYLYYDDPDFLGGDVTIHATQDISVLKDPTSSGSRFAINKEAIILPIYVGGGGGGSAVATYRPTAWESPEVSFADADSGTTMYMTIYPVNPTAAYDSNSTTYAQAGTDSYYDSMLRKNRRVTSPLIIEGFPARPAGTISSATLKVDWEGTGVGSPSIAYSMDNGNTWGGIGTGTSTRGTTSITLPTTQDLTAVRVRIENYVSPTVYSSTGYLNLYEAWIETT